MSLVKKIVLFVTIASILALVNPVIATPNTPKSSSVDSIEDLPSNSSSSNRFFRKACKKWMKDDILNVVIEHMHVTEKVKTILEKSAKFGVCIAHSSFCTCLRLRLEPLFDACVGFMGIKCLRHLTASDPSFRCTLNCANSLTKLDNEAMGAICSRKCVNRV